MRLQHGTERDEIDNLLSVGIGSQEKGEGWFSNIHD